MGAARLLGLPVPEALGGRGLPLTHVGRMLHRLAYLSGTTFAKLSLQPEFCSVLADHGSPDLVQKYYRPLLTGEALVGNQVTEPTAGSDVQALAMTARREGDEYVLNGTKSEAAFAVDAQAALVYARTAQTGGHPEITAFLVPQDLPGIRRMNHGDLGERWMRRGRVGYEDVRVPAGLRVGEEGKAFAYLVPELTRERALLAAIYLGVGRSAFDATVLHVRHRIAFEKPLSAQQAVSFPLVEDWAHLDASELFVDRVLGRLERGEPAEAESALAKSMATEVALRCLDHAIQFHGGRGYSSDLPFEQRWRDVRSGAIAHGSSEIMHVVASRRLFPRE